LLSWTPHIGERPPLPLGFGADDPPPRAFGPNTGTCTSSGQGARAFDGGGGRFGMAAFLLRCRAEVPPMGKVCRDGAINEQPISVLYHGGPQPGF